MASCEPRPLEVLQQINLEIGDLIVKKMQNIWTQRKWLEPILIHECLPLNSVNKCFDQPFIVSWGRKVVFSCAYDQFDALVEGKALNGR